jgi:hypothetical protein
MHRQEMIQQEIDQAELAGIADNPWAMRARQIDDAIFAIDAELRKPVERVDVPLPPLPATPVDIEVVQAEAPSHVRISIQGERLDYAEEIDWAERGTNVVHGDLQLVGGSLAKVASPLGLDVDAAEKLALSLFELATSARDSVLETGRPLGQVLVRDLLTPCPECGDLRLWNGVCLRCEVLNAARLQLENERKRLFDERDSILRDREAHIERLPSLRKRLAETNAAIERTRVSTSL